MPTMPPFTAGKIIRRGAFDPDGRVMRRYEREFEAAVSRALAKLRRDVERGITDENVNDMVSRLNDPAVTRPFQDAIVAQMQRVALAGAEHGRVTVEREIFGTLKAVEVGAWELANNAAAAWAMEYAYELVRGIVATTRDWLQLQIAEYINNSMTIGELIQRIQAGSGYSEDRAHRIGVTETTRAFAMGGLEAWKASGVIEYREWRTNNDELVCPQCGPLAGKVVRLDEEFEGGVLVPPRHPNCRCWHVPKVVTGA